MNEGIPGDGRRAAAVVTSLCLCLCLPAVAQESASVVEVEREWKGRHGAVACVDHYAARIGAEVLAEAGSAVDAAVAVAFALAVTHPAAGNLGGGGFMVVCHADGAATTFDYREVAPAAATSEMFLDADGAIDRKKAGIGHWVVGVPGTVAGLEMAHRRFGRLPWERLVRPAEELAANGIEIDRDLERSLAAHAAVFRRYPATARCFLRADGSAYSQGEVLRQPDLANSLRWIREGGADAFYRGPIADLIAAEMERAEALIRREDLANYRAIEREPVRFPYGEYEVVAMSPPSSGGVALRHILGILEPFALGGRDPDSAEVRHLLAEAQRRAFAERARFLGDPDATALDLDHHLSSQRLAELRTSIQSERASPSEDFGPPLTAAEGTHTTHFSVVDSDGNAVSNTYTLEQSYGSKVVAAGTGFLLNNELHDFNLKPGLTDREGRIGTDPNLPRAGRRPLSSMTPTIVRRDGRPVLVTGSPGGRTIINTVATVVWLHLEFGLPVDEAVAFRRQHHQWFPDRLSLERRGEDDGELESRLTARGHALRWSSRQGDAHSIAIQPDGSAHAVADRRLDGWAAGPTELRRGER